MINADTDAPRVRRDIINSVRYGLAKGLIDEVMNVDRVWTAGRSIIAAAVPVVADQLFFLVSTEITGWPAA